ncbi:MAG: ATPase [Clostridia bacterium]|nr:ATPase [Clostridia bacterium]
MMAEKIAAGWDGGGTKTRVCLKDAYGKDIAVCDFGPLNINGASEEVVRQSIRDAVQFMQRSCGKDMVCPELVIGMAGVSNRHATEFVEETVRQAGYQGHLQFLGDQEIALAGAITGHGAVLIAGTGSVCCGRDRNGKMFRVGGYGYLIDDPGSGYAIGRDILKSVVRAVDGRGRATCLKELVFQELKTDEVGGLITWLYSPATGKKEVAAMTRLLPEALRQGDETALAIAETAAEDLSEIVLAGWRKTGMEDGELALTGSILEHFDGIRESMAQRVHAVYPKIEIGFPKSDPAHGAAGIACKALTDGAALEVQRNPEK